MSSQANNSRDYLAEVKNEELFINNSSFAGVHSHSSVKIAAAIESHTKSVTNGFLFGPMDQANGTYLAICRMN